MKPSDFWKNVIIFANDNIMGRYRKILFKRVSHFSLLVLQIHFHLNDIKTRMDLLNSMTVPFNSGGSTNIAAALRDMRNIIFTVANGGYGE